MLLVCHIYGSFRASHVGLALLFINATLYSYFINIQLFYNILYIYIYIYIYIYLDNKSDLNKDVKYSVRI